jgi:lipid-binding SYLF domain-containing protein
MTRHSTGIAIALCVTIATGLVGAGDAEAASAAELNREASSALRRLTSSVPSARLLSQNAKAVLVFPDVVKAGFMFGGQIGEGVLLRKGKPSGYYNTVAASYGFQAGVQSFAYALFFMNEAAIDQLNRTHGFEVGVGPSIVLVDEGRARSITSNTITSDVYAFIFGQKGLMAGMGLQGSKITRIDK